MNTHSFFRRPSSPRYLHKVVFMLVAWSNLAFCAGTHVTAESAANQAIISAITDQFETDRDLTNIEIHRNPNDATLFVVLWDDGFWFKCLRVIHFKGGKIDWTAILDPKIGWGLDHDILEVDWKQLPRIGKTVLEVYTSTHRGNGIYGIWELRGHTLFQLLHVRAIGNFDYSAAEHPNRNPDILGASVQRRGRILEAKNSPFEEVIVDGSVKYLGEDGTTVIQEKPLHQVFIWNTTKEMFEEDLTKTKGTTDYLSIYSE